MRKRSSVEQALVKMEKEWRHAYASDDNSTAALLSTIEDPGYSPDILVDSEWAALHLGVCTKTVIRYRRTGVLRAIAIPSGPIRRVTWRYLISDLDEFLANHRNKKRYWDPDRDELPVPIVSKLLNSTPASVHVLRSRGQLKSYLPEDVREYLLMHSRKAQPSIRRCFRAGEAIRNIAEKDRVSVAAVRSSIKQAKTREHEADLIHYVKMKLEGRIQNDRRQKVIQENYPKVIKGIKRRLDGKRTIVEVNKITGERTKHTFEDIDKIASGVRILTKILYDA